MPLPPGWRLGQGQYQIERLLGEGGCALVYLARQGPWNLQVCIKEFFPFGCQRDPSGLKPLSPQYERRARLGLQAFNDEAATLARFRHPGIVGVLGTFEENGTAYLVQEFLEGMTFRDGMTRAGVMPEALVLQVAQQVGQALLMVHGAGLVHSDLKPDNLFITREGRYVLLDFGLTRGFLSQDGAQMGMRGRSPGYAPPEQYQPGAVLTPASDVYAFAATLYALLTGKPPPDALDRLKGQGLPAIQPPVSPKVEQALQQALATDPNARTPGVREFLFQLGLDITPRAVAYRPAPFQALNAPMAHRKGVSSMTLAGERLYAAVDNGVVSAWSWPDLAPLGERKVQERTITAMSVSADGRFLVTGSESGTILLIVTDSAEPGLLLHQEPVQCNSLGFSGDLVAAAFTNGKCCLLGPALPAPRVWEAHQGMVTHLDFHPDGNLLATAGRDAMVRFWSVPDGRLLREFQAHAKSVSSVRFSPDGRALLTSSLDLSVRFWDVSHGRLIRDLRGHNSLVFEARFTCFPNLVVSLAGDHTLRAFQLDSGRVVCSSEARTERWRTLLADPARPLVATAAEDGRICLWGLGDAG